VVIFTFAIAFYGPARSDSIAVALVLEDRDQVVAHLCVVPREVLERLEREVDDDPIIVEVEIAFQDCDRAGALRGRKPYWSFSSA
jgi:hypothetical protein